jgi:hypothetical protein
LVWRWACRTGNYERELLALFYHCWCPGVGGVFLPSHNKIHDTHTDIQIIDFWKVGFFFHSFHFASSNIPFKNLWIKLNDAFWFYKFWTAESECVHVFFSRHLLAYIMQMWGAIWASYLQWLIVEVREYPHLMVS